MDATMSSNQSGFFISFEGIDGAGKSTHINAYCDLLKSRFPDRTLVVTREPGGTDRKSVV